MPLNAFKNVLMFNFSNLHLPCFLKRLSLIPRFAAAFAPPGCRPCRLNNFGFAPIFLSPSITFSLTCIANMFAAGS